MSQDWRTPEMLPDEGFIRAVWPERLIRFMFSDGTLLDVRTSRDDSDLRGAVLDYVRRTRKLTKDTTPTIAGMATITTDVEVE